MPRLGFRVVGNARTPARYARAAFAAYAACDPKAEVEQDLLLPAFTFATTSRPKRQDQQGLYGDC